MPDCINLVFCGTPAFAVPTLEKLVSSGFSIPLVVTQPDRPKGRGLELVPSPVKQAALAHSLQVTQPEKIRNNEEFRATLEGLKPDAIVVVGYGRIIPPWMLDLPAMGNINLHASLLPKYRGAAPIQWAIAQGERVTGNTTMRIDEGLDTGDILMQQECPIQAEDTAESLAPRLAAMGAEMMAETLRGLRSGEVLPRPQDQAKATLAPILKKEDGLIDFARPADQIFNRLRGFQPWPGAYTKFRGKQVRLFKASPTGETLPPGQLQIVDTRLVVGCGRGSLEILELQMEGKRRMSARDFVHGYQPKPGEPLG